MPPADPHAKDYNHFLEDRLRDNVLALFGALPVPERTAVLQAFEWVDLPGGAFLCRQGDVGDSLYVLISGRLKVMENAETDAMQTLAEIPQGETVGEMSLITGEPRVAHVLAMRDCVLARLSKSRFEQLSGTYPHLMQTLSRKVIQRLRDTQVNKKVRRKVTNICLLPISPGLPVTNFAMELMSSLKAYGSGIFLDSHLVDGWLGQQGHAQTPRDNSKLYRALTSWLEEREHEYRFVVYAPDLSDTEWTRRCLRQADEILLLADPESPPDLHAFEKMFLHGPLRMAAADQVLVFWHPEGTERPHDTRAWTSKRMVRTHHHIRKDNRPDMDRLARMISGHAIGLVLSGGAAKGFAHIGAYRAMESLGIPVDVVGGTSIGAVMGALIARGWDSQMLREQCREVFKKSPTRDFNFFPRVSIFKGKTLEALLHAHFEGHTLEDCWLNYYCISCNLSKTQPVVHDHGPLEQVLRASISIPGIFPPALLNGDLHVDGGVFNNLPVDVMSKKGVGTIISVDLQAGQQPQASRAPSTTLPGLVYVVMESTMLSGRVLGMHYRKAIDVYINPPLRGFSLVDWHKFDQIEAIGYRAALQVLQEKSSLFVNHFDANLF